MEALGQIRAQEVSGPEKTVDVTRSGVAQERVRTEEKGQMSERADQKPTQEGRAKIERIAEAMDNYVKSVQRDLNIRVDHESGKVMVKVLSRETGEVIREIPPEELLKLAARMEEMAGMLLNESA
ncbi:MAG: flagellar protein FlaG [Thermodesulfobacteriota bacterium]